MKSLVPHTMENFEKTFPEILQNITHSGEKNLDEKKIKKIEELTGLSSKHCKLSYQHILRHLEKKHSEVRFSALLICDYLVRNNKSFRKLLIGEDMTKFMELTLGTNKSSPLPAPKTATKELHNKALSVIYKWHSDFGQSHMELANAFFFLKDCMKVDFKALEKQNSAERVKAEMNLKRAEAKRDERLKKALIEFKDHLDVAQSLCTELESCISLLLPTLSDFFVPGDQVGAISSEAGSSSGTSLRAHGIVSAAISIPINFSKSVPKIVINDDNLSIVECARDLYSQVTKSHAKRVEFWTVAFANQPDHLAKYQTCKALNEQIKKCVAQFDELGMKNKKRSRSEISEEEDFEEVDQKDGYEDKVQEDLLANLIASKAKKAAEEPCPKKRALDVAVSKIKTPVKPKEKLPTDIKDWEERVVALPPVIVGNRPDNSQVWIGASVSDSEEIKVPVIESCPVEIISTFEPVKWTCRAPLPNGNLCPRKDRVKCPFHGKIVPRDEVGNFKHKADEKADQLRKERHMQENPDWQDPQLLAELKKTTGFDLTIPKKGQRLKKAPEFPGLTDLSAKKDSPRKRLARKILSRSEMRQLRSKLEIEPGDSKEREFYLGDDPDS